jgi:hypothetical protein
MIEDSGGTMRAVIDEPLAWGADISPDGNWIAYISQSSGTPEILVRAFPDGDIDRQVSIDGGLEPIWCRDCDELYFRRGNKWYASQLEFEPELTIGTPELLFEVPGFVDTAGISYDVSRDGQRFLVLIRKNEPERTKLNLVQNWFTELNRLAPHPTP